MKQSFEHDVMKDLAEDASAADEAGAFEGEDFDESMDEEADEGFEEESFDAMDEEGFDEDYGDDHECAECSTGFEDDFDGFEEMDEDPAGDGYVDFAGFDEDALVLELADTLDEEDGDAFLRRLLATVSRVAAGVRGAAGHVQRGVRVAQRGADTVVRAAQTVQRVAKRGRQIAGQVGDIAGRFGGIAARVERVAGPASQAGSELASLRLLLRSILGQGKSEADAFDAVADFYAEAEIDAALPVRGAMTARAAIRSQLRRGARLSRALRRGLMRSAVRTSRALVRRRGPTAVRAMPRIARGVARVAARRRLPPQAVATALRRATARAAAQPALLRRLGGVTTARPAHVHGARRLVLQGPVEIVIRPRR